MIIQFPEQPVPIGALNNGVTLFAYKGGRYTYLEIKDMER